jgi:hypothetical protein
MGGYNVVLSCVFEDTFSPAFIVIKYNICGAVFAGFCVIICGAKICFTRFVSRGHDDRTQVSGAERGTMSGAMVHDGGARCGAMVRGYGAGLCPMAKGQKIGAGLWKRTPTPSKKSHFRLGVGLREAVYNPNTTTI